MFRHTTNKIILFFSILNASTIFCASLESAAKFATQPLVSAREFNTYFGHPRTAQPLASVRYNTFVRQNNKLLTELDPQAQDQDMRMQAREHVFNACLLKFSKGDFNRLLPAMKKCIAQEFFIEMMRSRHKEISDDIEDPKIRLQQPPLLPENLEPHFPGLSVQDLVDHAIPIIKKQTPVDERYRTFYIGADLSQWRLNSLAGLRNIPDIETCDAIFLCYNALTHIPDRAFSNFHLLRHVNLLYNPIISASPLCFVKKHDQSGIQAVFMPYLNALNDNTGISLRCNTAHPVIEPDETIAYLAIKKELEDDWYFATPAHERETCAHFKHLFKVITLDQALKILNTENILHHNSLSIPAFQTKLTTLLKRMQTDNKLIDHSRELPCLSPPTCSTSSGNSDESATSLHVPKAEEPSSLSLQDFLDQGMDFLSHFSSCKQQLTLSGDFTSLDGLQNIEGIEKITHLVICKSPYLKTLPDRIFMLPKLLAINIEHCKQLKQISPLCFIQGYNVDGSPILYKYGIRFRFDFLANFRANRKNETPYITANFEKFESYPVSSAEESATVKHLLASQDQATRKLAEWLFILITPQQALSWIEKQQLSDPDRQQCIQALSALSQRLCALKTKNCAPKTTKKKNGKISTRKKRR